jgi:hypothetical protein
MPNPRQKPKAISGKYLNPKTAGSMAQVVLHLPSKNKALSSNPSTAKKKKKVNLRRRETEKEAILMEKVSFISSSA